MSVGVGADVSVSEGMGAEADLRFREMSTLVALKSGSVPEAEADAGETKRRGAGRGFRPSDLRAGRGGGEDNGIGTGVETGVGAVDKEVVAAVERRVPEGRLGCLGGLGGRGAVDGREGEA